MRVLGLRCVKPSRFSAEKPAVSSCLSFRPSKGLPESCPRIWANCASMRDLSEAGSLFNRLDAPWFSPFLRRTPYDRQRPTPMLGDGGCRLGGQRSKLERTNCPGVDRKSTSKLPGLSFTTGIQPTHEKRPGRTHPR